MQYEVEKKFRIDDWSNVKRKVGSMNAVFHPSVRQYDQYYAHPARDFAATDEALRIRTAGGHSWITYKGPRLDSTSKTRQELELQLPDPGENGGGFGKILSVLGFQEVALVEKERYHAILSWQNRRCKIAFDNVEVVGRFIELEVITDASGYSAAKSSLEQLAEHLGLSENVPRSYLELVLEKTGD